MVKKFINPYPANIFFSENEVCLLRLLHMFKCTLYYFYESSNNVNPDQTAPTGAMTVWPGYELWAIWATKSWKYTNRWEFMGVGGGG